MRKILVNTTDINLKYVYFQIYLLDGKTPAIDFDGLQSEVSISGASYETDNIGPLIEIGLGSYRALLSDYALSTIGNVILTHFFNIGTLDAFGEPIEVVADLGQLTIFENSGDSPLFLSYTSIPEAENYFSVKFNSGDWDTATLQDKMKSLSSATNDIENLRFSGIKTDPNQILEFPRTVNGVISNIVPVNIKKACCEIALGYILGVNLEDEIDNSNIASEGFANVNESYSSVTPLEYLRAGINSAIAWNYLKPFLVDPLSLRIARA